MIEKLTDWLIKRKLKRDAIPVHNYLPKREMEFRKVLNTLRENKVMVKTTDDGVYIRLAGNESNGQAFSKEFVKVISF